MNWLTDCCSTNFKMNVFKENFGSKYVILKNSKFYFYIVHFHTKSRSCNPGLKTPQSMQPFYSDIFAGMHHH